jgi:type IV pilus assembly protein PilV
MSPVKKRLIGAGRACQRGSMMIEVLVSVLLLSVSILGLVRVLANSMQDAGELEYRSVASTVADESIGRMWVADRADLDALEVADQAVPQLPNGLQTIEVDDDVVTVTITWQAPNSAGPSNHQVTATIPEDAP